MANVLVGETENFKIWYDPTLLPTNPEVVTNATALMATVEADFAKVGGWFGISSGFGSGNRINVNLTWTIANGKNGGADNFGYKSDGTCQIDVNGAPPWSPVPAVIRMLFVAELSEVFMTFTGFSWNPGDSNGEGLSRLCAYLISPVGYFGVSGLGDVNAWMLSPRTSQYITGPPAPTDKSQPSYGTAFLYLLYLYSQLGHPAWAIVRAGGPTLAAVFQNLGGTGDAFAPYVALLNDFFPQGKPGDATSGALKVVDPFPLLYSGSGRSLVVTGVDQLIGNALTLAKGEAYVAPFFTCPKKLYGFTVEGQPTQVVLTATAYGFGQATFLWTLNGTPLTAGAGSPNVTVTYTGRDIPGGSQTETTGLSFVGQEYPVATRLGDSIVLTLNEPFGSYEIVVECIATEMYAVASTESGTWFDAIDDRATEWDANFYRDQKACEAQLRDIISRYVNVHVPFLIALTLPDPPPDYTQAVQLLKSAGEALRVLDEMPARDRRLLEKAIEYRFGVSASALLGLAEKSRGERSEG